jgi:phosphoglycerate kinase
VEPVWKSEVQFFQGCLGKEDQMENAGLDLRLRLVQGIDLKDQIVLVRVDHNVVKKGQIKDPYRIDATVKTLFAIFKNGGRPILMSHVGRPKDKKTGQITCQEGESVIPIANYLERKLPLKIHVPVFNITEGRGIVHIEDSIQSAIEDLRTGRIDMIYLPNTRWFQGEQAKGEEKETFARELADLADIYLNDAFGSWQAHVSTYDVALKMPSYAGLLLQAELANLYSVLKPRRPFIAVIAGAKYDTKIGPLKALYKQADHLVLGGLLYNTFLSAKYNINIAGVEAADKALARELVEMDNQAGKILEMPYLVESDTLEGRIEGKYRTKNVEAFKEGDVYQYFCDIDPRSLEQERVKEALGSAKTIFTNAVMGLMPHFPDGSASLYRLIASNHEAMKLFGGGDTLQELKNLCPGIYMAGVEDPNTYYFTGGGAVLAAVEQGSAYQIKPIEALMDK